MDCDDDNDDEDYDDDDDDDDDGDEDRKPSAFRPSSADEPNARDEETSAQKRKVKPLNLYQRFIPRTRDRSKSSYLRRNERHGKRLIANYEKRRKVAAESEGIMLESSDSSVDELPIQEDLKDTVDWYNVANSYATEYALLDSLPVWEMYSLVGWATHLTRDNEPLPSAADDIEMMSTSVAEDRESLYQFNPLRGLVSTPLPPSHLEYISSLATKITLEFEECLELNAMFDQSALVAIGMLLEEMLTTTMLPLARAHVQACREREHKISLEQAEAAKKLAETWYPETSASAKAASSTSLKQHPVATQMQKVKDRQRADRAAVEDLFHQRTLPPEEAILSLIRDRKLDSTMGLPVVFPPTRTLCENRRANAPHVIASHWCTHHKLEMNFVQCNMDIFSAFLPIAPNLADEDDEESDEEEDEPQNEGLI